MKERPISYTTPMALAKWEGRKTTTRRPMKPQPNIRVAGHPAATYELMRDWVKEHPCPYGLAGDRLWAKESYLVNAFGKPLYLADYREKGLEWKGMGWKSGRFMPRRVSRMLDELVEVRFARLFTDTTDQDAQAESFADVSEFFDYWDRLYKTVPTLQVQSNPWVWVLVQKPILYVYPECVQ